MATYKVRFEPVKIEIEVNERETVLDAAFRQGVLLMHGCKEGQCAACKSFLLDGDMTMKKYSTFALPEFESEEGYVLLCRCMPDSDLDIELINFDAELINSGVSVRQLQATVVEIETLTHDIRRLLLKLDDSERMEFKAGQYADIRIPGTDEYRSYSMSNTPTQNDHLEFMIKIFPGGRFSSLLESLAIGQKLEVKGPYGVFRLHEQVQSEIVCIGGGSGMAPIWSLLNDMAERGIKRKATYYYGARTRKDLFYLEQMQALAQRLPGFTFVPVLSALDPEDIWEGEKGFVTDVVERGIPTGHRTLQVYLCGPGPMIDVALPMLARKGISEDRIFYDKFTPTGSV